MAAVSSINTHHNRSDQGRTGEHGSGRAGIYAMEQSDFFDTYPSVYTSLGFFAFFFCAFLYYWSAPTGEPELDQARYIMGLVGCFISGASAMLCRNTRTWRMGHDLLVYGLLIMAVVLQFFTGTGIRNATMPGTLVLIFYMGQIRGQRGLVLTFVACLALYTALYMLEVLQWIPGSSPDKRSLTITYIFFVCLACIAFLCCLARYKKDWLLVERLAEEKTAAYQAKLAEQQAEGLYKRQLEITQTKDHFISFLAHEVKNPILTMKSALAHMRDGQVDEVTRQRILNSFEKQLDSLLPVIGNVLEAGRLDSPSIRLNHERFDFAELVQATLDSYRTVAQTQRIELDCVMQLAPACFFGDAVKLRQMLGNYISNALKYSKLLASQCTYAIWRMQPMRMAKYLSCGFPMMASALISRSFRTCLGSITKMNVSASSISVQAWGFRSSKNWRS